VSSPEFASVVQVSPEVGESLACGSPVVALETAVVSHGLPYPLSLQAAEEMQREVQAAGAVPAVVAVVDGRVWVGASRELVERLARPGTWKVAERDLPVAVARGATGGLTVSATVAVADRVGVPVVATGGVGGVHLGGAHTWDVSGDLQALAGHPVAVVCSGAKAVCDPQLTLEYLETSGVTVLGYRTGRFPYFYAHDSGFPVPHRAESPEEVAWVLLAQRALGRRAGLLVANPPPAEAALSRDEVDRAVRAAAARAAAQGVRGADLTPYLLSALAELTGGRSLQANLALLRANARLAGEVAVAFSRLGAAGQRV